MPTVDFHSVTGIRLGMAESPRTKGEIVFEDYLNFQGIPFGFEKEHPGKTKRPDYTIEWGGKTIVLDVKDFDPPDTPLSGFGAFDPFRCGSSSAATRQPGRYVGFDVRRCGVHVPGEHRYGNRRCQSNQTDILGTRQDDPTELVAGAEYNSVRRHRGLKDQAVPDGNDRHDSHSRPN